MISWCQNFVNYQHFYLKFLSIGFILFLNWKLSKFFFVISKTSLWLLLSTTLCDKVCQWLATVWWFSLGTLVSSTNKTDHHDITEILLKVALNSINPHIYSGQQWKIKKVLFIKKNAFVESGVNNTNILVLSSYLQYLLHVCSTYILDHPEDNFLYYFCEIINESTFNIILVILKLQFHFNFDDIHMIK